MPWFIPLIINWMCCDFGDSIPIIEKKSSANLFLKREESAYSAFKCSSFCPKKFFGLMNVMVYDFLGNSLI
jgi:hypothetical protein